MKQKKKRKLPRALKLALWSVILLIALYGLLLCRPFRFRSYRIPLWLAEKEAMLGKGVIVDYLDGQHSGSDSAIVSYGDELFAFGINYDYHANTGKIRKKYHGAVLCDSSVASWGCTSWLGWDMMGGRLDWKFTRNVYVRCTDADVVGGEAELKLAWTQGNKATIRANAERLNESFLKITFVYERYDLVFENSLYAILELNCRDANGTLLHSHTIPIKETEA